jgi:hypothetical protein
VAGRRQKAAKARTEQSATCPSADYSTHGRPCQQVGDETVANSYSTSKLSLQPLSPQPGTSSRNSDYEIQNAQLVDGGSADCSGAATCHPHPEMPGTFIVRVASKTIIFDLYEPAPIFSDHLLSLIRYNLYRAVASNSCLIGVDPRLMHTDIISPFNRDKQAVDNLCRSLPPFLCPTVLQRSICHHPYIDIMPFPAMRDRLIQLGDTLDHDSLCADFAGEGINLGPGVHTGLTVWAEPCDPRSWEIAEALWKKWPLLFTGCPGLLETTNHWRRRRDVPPLVELS